MATEKRVYQDVIEVVEEGQAKARASQLVLEVAKFPTDEKIRLSQFVLELIIPRNAQDDGWIVKEV